MERKLPLNELKDFYVTCTRAKNSLAVVMYTNNSEGVKTETIKKGWFEESEIIVM